MKYVVIGILVFAFLSSGCKKGKDNTVLFVDDEPITLRELEFWMSLSKAEVSAYFFRKYGVQYTVDFWENEYGNESPLAMLKEKAIERIVRCKVQQMYARELGVIKNIGFDELMTEMNVVNQKRKMSQENGEPIYGPIQFSSHTYFDHVFDKMVYKVKLHLLKNYLSTDALIAMNKLKSKEFIFKGKSGIQQMQFIDNKYDQMVLEMVYAAELAINMDLFEKVTLK